MLRTLYVWSWVAIEFLIDIYELCWLVFVLLRNLVLRSYDRICCNCSGSINQREFSQLERCLAQLSKKPRHIAVILDTTAKFVNADLLQRICKYALHMRIDCISIYNTKTLDDESTVLAQIKAPPAYAQHEIVSEQHARWTVKSVSTKLLKNGMNGLKNGTCTPHLQSLEIFEFTPRDNYNSLVELCRELFNKRDTKEVQKLLEQRDNLTHYLNEHLTQRLFAKESKYFAEPELCIVFSKDFCTYGMLPWHTRFTEFYHLKTGAGFDATQFTEILCKYSRCEQRWGK